MKIAGEDALRQNIVETKRYISEHGGSGHVVLDSNGTSMTQRGKLQFIGATVTDDATNNKTVVSVASGVAAVGLTTTTLLNKTITVTNSSGTTIATTKFSASGYAFVSIPSADTYTFTVTY